MSRPRCADTRLCIIASGIAMSANDTVDQSMIADGSCRMTTPDPTGLDGNALWHYYEGRVKSVLDAISDLPDSSSPEFAGAARDAIPPKCKIAPQKSNTVDFYDITQLAQSVDNWHTALCAPDGAATEPWQRAVTVGYVCTVACDLNEVGPMGDTTYASFAVDKATADSVTRSLCRAIPADERFDKLTQAQLAAALRPAISSPSPCICSDSETRFPWA
mmetsp:Transcript_10410/g.38384  ORF Transcript_10410/g.38384 Transcript_10410/m.38384 type:complete len:218 (-) Transcript_10410:586-1239(-)